MLRTMVVALDGSGFAEQALSVATALAHRAGASLHLVMVHLPAPIDPGVQRVTETWTAAIRDQERRYLARVGERAGAVLGAEAVTTALLDGPVVEALQRYLEAQRADLAVIASHGRGGVSRAWLGSVADRLVRQASGPLLVVRPREGEAPAPERQPAFRRILVALDGSELAETVLPTAAHIGELEEDAEYLLLRVVAPPFAIRSPAMELSVEVDAAERERRVEQAEAYLSRIGRRLESETGRRVRTLVVVHAAAANAILDVAAEERADVIGIATHGRGGVRRLVLGSVADKVLRGVSVPVLLQRASERDG